jgi:uncharacterized protein (TIGR02466 family)
MTYLRGVSAAPGAPLPAAVPVTLDWGTRWVTRLYTARNPLHERLRAGLRERLYALEASEAASRIAPLAKSGLYESRFDLFERDLPELRTLRAFCEAVVEQVARGLHENVWEPAARVRVQIVDSWFHITRDGGYHDVHSHAMCSWCGIYYVDIGDSTLRPPNGINRFYDPRGNTESFSDLGTKYLREESCVDMPPEDGALLLFPSYLRHSALPYRGTRDRIVVAFNASIQPG